MDRRRKEGGGYERREGRDGRRKEVDMRGEREEMGGERRWIWE